MVVKSLASLSDKFFSVFSMLFQNCFEFLLKLFTISFRSIDILRLFFAAVALKVVHVSWSMFFIVLISIFFKVKQYY